MEPIDYKTPSIHENIKLIARSITRGNILYFPRLVVGEQKTICLGLVHMESKKCPNPTNLIQIWLKTHYFDSNLRERSTFLTPCVRAFRQNVSRSKKRVVGQIVAWRSVFPQIYTRPT